MLLVLLDQAFKLLVNYLLGVVRLLLVVVQVLQNVLAQTLMHHNLFAYGVAEHSIDILSLKLITNQLYRLPNSLILN